MGGRPVSGGVKLIEVRISNFRSLRDVVVPLDNLTVLVGANNAGKTSFLDAIYAAIGAGRRLLGKEDIHLPVGEIDIPKDRKAVIDLLFRPTTSDAELTDVFPGGSFWTNLWGTNIAQDLTGDFVGLRTCLQWNPVHAEYRVERRFLKEWKDPKEWLSSSEGERISGVHIEPISLYYIDAQRDLDEDLRTRGSFWRRLTDELGLTEADVATFETLLSELNQKIVNKSEVLKHLRETLDGLKQVVADQTSSIDISPVARQLRDLSKGVDVSFSHAGGQHMPLVRHGMGTRSLASLLVFRAFSTWREAQANKTGDLIHTLLALEEPEAHLHPQAQRSLFSQVRSIPGQRIVSTHSPYFVGQVALEFLRLFRRDGSETSVVSLDLSKLKPDDKRKLEQKVVATRGDLFFARALILFEGETEELMLPVFAEEYWGATIHELGISSVGVGGHSGYFPYIWLAKNLTIPWFIHGDGEDLAISELDRNLKRAASLTHDKADNVIVLPNKNDFEKQLIEEGFLPEIEKAIDKEFGAGWFNKFVADMHGRPGAKGVVRDYNSHGGRERAATDVLRGDKTQLALTVALEIVAAKKIPKFIEQLFEMVSKRLGLTAKKDRK